MPVKSRLMVIFIDLRQRFYSKLKIFYRGCALYSVLYIELYWDPSNQKECEWRGIWYACVNGMVTQYLSRNLMLKSH